MVHASAFCPASLPARRIGQCRPASAKRRNATTFCVIAPAATAPSRTKADVLALVQASIKAKVQFAKIRPDLAGDGSCSMRASYNIAAGEALISLPAAACLRVHAGDAAPGGCLPPSTWAALPWQARLAIRLLYEERRGKASPFAAYLACLPRRIDAPAVWSDAELAQLQYPHVQAAAAEQRRQAQDLHATLAQQSTLQGVQLQDVERALTLVRSRTFAAPYLSVPLSAALPAAAALQVLVGAAAITAGAGTAGGVECIGLLCVGAAVRALLQQAGRSSDSSGIAGSEEGQHVMAPMMDLLNHSSAVEQNIGCTATPVQTACCGGQPLQYKHTNARQFLRQASCQYDPWADEFRVVASQQYAASEEVLINYGELDSDALLLLYGFVEPNNPFERYRLPSLLDTVAAARGAAGTKEAQEHTHAVGKVTAVLQETGLEGALDEVLLDKQAPPPGTLAVLQQLLVATAHSGSSSNSIKPRGSTACQALLVEVCKSELQRLGESHQHDEQLLEGIHRRPRTKEQLARVQEQLLSLELELGKVLAAQQNIAAATGAERDEASACMTTGAQSQPSEEVAVGLASSTPLSTTQGDADWQQSEVATSRERPAATADSDTAAAAALAKLNGDIFELHEQRQALTAEVDALATLTAGVKDLAVQFRIEKRRFLRTYINDHECV